MHRRSGISKGLFARPAGRGPLPHWRNIFIALALVLAIGSAGQTQAAQAAPAGTTALHFTMSALKELGGPACKGELVHIIVTVRRDAEEVGAEGDELADLGNNLTGIDVKALVQNPKVGSISPPSNTTHVAGMITANSADFIFTAENYGETTISFRGLVVTPGWFGTNWGGGSQAVSDSVRVQVIPCAYKFNAAIRFPVEIYDITVISDDALMTRNEGGYLPEHTQLVSLLQGANFTGSTSMHWVYSNFNLDPCTIEISATDSQVDLSGQLDDDGGQFMGTATFQPQTDSGIVTCPGGSGGGTFGFTVAPLTFSVASSGGVVTQTATAEGVSGTATIVLTPEEGQAVFIPGQHEAGWDYFSSLFGTLLALH